VGDLARLLAIQAGPDPRLPLAIAQRFELPEGLGDADALRDVRIAWLGDLRGHLAIEGGLLERCEAALDRCAAGGAQVEAVAPPFDPAAVWQAWLVWRHALVARRVGALLSREGARAAIKPEALWEHDQAQGLSAGDFIAASEARSFFHARMLELFDRFDLVALPATQVWPFPIEWTWPRSIAGRAMDSYHRWMEVTIYATFCGAPAISVPAGFHDSGRWPAGLQLIARPGGDAQLLRIAAAYESASSDLLSRRPTEPETSD
jgi:amidase